GRKFADRGAPPLTNCNDVEPRTPRRDVLIAQLQQKGLENPFRVAHNADGHWRVLPDFGPIDIDVNDLAADSTCPPTGRQRSETDANREDVIGALECFTPELMDHPPVAEGQVVIFGDDALARVCHDDRNRKSHGELLHDRSGLPCPAAY